MQILSRNKQIQFEVRDAVPHPFEKGGSFALAIYSPEITAHPLRVEDARGRKWLVFQSGKHAVITLRAEGSGEAARPIAFGNPEELANRIAERGGYDITPTKRPPESTKDGRLRVITAGLGRRMVVAENATATNPHAIAALEGGPWHARALRASEIAFEQLSALGFDAKKKEV